MSEPLKYSHYGRCRCERCGTTNRFRSDFTYQVGEWVMDHVCRGPVCDGARRDQRVILLTETHEQSELPKEPDEQTMQAV